MSSFAKGQCKKKTSSLRLEVKENLLLQSGNRALQIPSRHSIVWAPTKVYPTLHEKLNVLPWSKLLPFLPPCSGIPGSLQLAYNRKNTFFHLIRALINFLVCY